MNERDVSEAFTEWIGDLLDIPAEARYPYPVAQKTGPLTSTQADVAAVVDRKRTMPTQQAVELFPWLTLEEMEPITRVFEVAASVMFAVEQTEDSALEVFQRLQAVGAALEDSAIADSTLGDRVPMISPVMEFDYSAVFAETEDGTRGRMIVCAFTAGELVGDFDAFG